MNVSSAVRSDATKKIIDQAGEFKGVFRSRIPIGEASRSIAAESVRDMVDIGLARFLVPSEHGGLDLCVGDAVEVTTTIARADASTGWISWLLMHVPHAIAMFSAEAQNAVWENGPDVVTAGSHIGMTVSPVAGGYRISGGGAFTSGVNNADWVYVGGFEPPAGSPPLLRYFLLERSQYTVGDTWRTVGMRGTGSNTVVVDDVFVPEAFTLTHDDAREGRSPGSLVNASPALRLPWVTKGSLGFLGTIVGAAQGAFDDVVASVAQKKTPGGARVADSEVLQMDVGMVSAKLDGAQTLLRALAARTDAGGEFTMDERAKIPRTASLIVTLVLEAMDKVVELAGTSGFATPSFVQQAWRDIRFASAHISLTRREPWARYGRLMLGVADNPGMFY